jgi:hypothetical protein
MANTNTKLKKLPDFVTGVMEVKWSNLMKPDNAFGEASANHNITVVLDSTLEKQLADLLKKSGAKKINGIYEKDGLKTFKAKSRVHIEAGKFPCVDSNAEATDAVAFGGDKVRLRLAPAVVARDNSLSLYLNGIQIVEKNTNNVTGAGGFDTVKGGFVGTTSTVASSAPQVTETEDEDLPF